MSHGQPTPTHLTGPSATTAWRRLTSTVPGVPRWAQMAAHLVPLVVLPSSIWRLALGVGIPVGFTGELAVLYRAPGWLTVYVIGLNIAAEACALLTFGLIQPWGERVPAWVPRIGGRPIPAMAVVVPATLGALAVTTINWTSAFMWFGPENNGDPDAPHGLAGFIMAAAYAPMLAWGPLVGAVTASYYVRRRQQRRCRNHHPATAGFA